MLTLTFIMSRYLLIAFNRTAPTVNFYPNNRYPAGTFRLRTSMPQAAESCIHGLPRLQGGYPPSSSSQVRQQTSFDEATGEESIRGREKREFSIQRSDIQGYKSLF